MNKIKNYFWTKCVYLRRYRQKINFSNRSQKFHSSRNVDIYGDIGKNICLFKLCRNNVLFKKVLIFTKSKSVLVYALHNLGLTWCSAVCAKIYIIFIIIFTDISAKTGFRLKIIFYEANKLDLNHIIFFNRQKKRFLSTWSQINIILLEMLILFT